MADKQLLRLILDQSAVGVHSENSDESWPRGYKTFFKLNSTEHEISLGHENKDTNN